jgi:predicted extracellular nuclease
VTRFRTGAAASAAALVLTLLALPAASPAAAVAPPVGEVFVNELHYDNAGTDSGEAIEIAGPAGTSLTGWSLVLYNGANGGPYGTRELEGTLPDQQDGFGAVAFRYPVNGIQNGAPDGIALVDGSGQLVQFLSYEGALTADGGPADAATSTNIGVVEGSGTPAGRSLQLTGTATRYGGFTWSAPAAESFGEVNAGQRFSDSGGTASGDTPEPCELPLTHEIGVVQGSGERSPVAGESVVVQGVVVGDFQEADELRGVFLQDGDGDGDAFTSDGVFVFDPDAPAVTAGDVLRVSGVVSEYRGLTQISDVRAIGDCGDGSVPAPQQLALPAEDVVRERVEAMLVTLTEPVTATETYSLARYGELVVSADGRLYQPTNDGGEEVAVEQQRNDIRRLVVDDASTVQNPEEIPFTDVDGRVIRLGDTVTELTGVLSYGFGAWRLQPTSEPVVTGSNPRPASPDDVGGQLQVASFNVLNYFTTIDGPGVTTDAGHQPRGADSESELARQQAKIIAAILALDAEVVGLMEIENDAANEALAHLVAALNDASGEDRYAALDEPDTGDGLFGSDAIKVAMIYQPDQVVPLGASVTTQDEAFDNARLPLAQRFRPTGGGQPFTVVVNHFKSKSCRGATGQNADQGDGQGCYNADRVEQAEALVELVESLHTKDVLIVGDLNAYGEEDPVDVLRAAGFVDLVDRRLPEADQYSYVFQGQAGYLDHALASERLARRVTGVDLWHINADEALFLDYNTEFNPDGFYRADPYRSSDHDPVLVGLAPAPGSGRGPR